MLTHDISKNVDTVAGRKLVYREEEKRKSICLEMCDDDDDDDVTTRMYMQYKVVK